MKVSAAELLNEIRNYTISSIPRGQYFRISSIKRPATSRNNIAGLKMRNGKRIVGSNIGRRSAPGQPPAIQTGRLINSINARRVQEFKYRIGTSVIYAPILDNPNGLNRPFFKVIANSYRPKFYANIRRALEG